MTTDIAPPTWAEIKEDPFFQSQPRDKKLEMADAWLNDIFSRQPGAAEKATIARFRIRNEINRNYVKSQEFINDRATPSVNGMLPEGTDQEAIKAILDEDLQALNRGMGGSKGTMRLGPPQMENDDEKAKVGFKYLPHPFKNRIEFTLPSGKKVEGIFDDDNPTMDQLESVFAEHLDEFPDETFKSQVGMWDAVANSAIKGAYTARRRLLTGGLTTKHAEALEENMDTIEEVRKEFFPDVNRGKFLDMAMASEIVNNLPEDISPEAKKKVMDKAKEFATLTGSLKGDQRKEFLDSNVFGKLGNLIVGTITANSDTGQGGFQPFPAESPAQELDQAIRLSQVNRQVVSMLDRYENAIGLASPDLQEHPAIKEMNEADANDGGAFWKAFTKAPATISLAVMTESLVSQPEVLIGAGTIAARTAGSSKLARIGGTSAAVGVLSGRAEMMDGYMQSISEVAKELDLDIENPADAEKFFENTDALKQARDKALTRGITIGTFEGLTASVGGVLLGRVLNKGTIAQVSGALGESAIGGLGGMAGETAAQLISDGEINDLRSIYLEFAGEAPGGLASAAVNTGAGLNQIREQLTSRGDPGGQGPPVNIDPNSVESTLPEEDSSTPQAPETTLFPNEEGDITPEGSILPQEEEVELQEPEAEQNEQVEQQPEQRVEEPATETPQPVQDRDGVEQEQVDTRESDTDQSREDDVLPEPAPAEPEATESVEQAEVREAEESFQAATEERRQARQLVEDSKESGDPDSTLQALQQETEAIAQSREARANLDDARARAREAQEAPPTLESVEQEEQPPAPADVLPEPEPATEPAPAPEAKETAGITSPPLRPVEFVDFEEDFEAAESAENGANKIADAVDMGITRDRDLTAVVRNDQGEVEGALWTAYDPGEDVYTFDVAVSPSAQGQGVGSRLIDLGIQEFDNQYSDIEGSRIELHAVSKIAEGANRRRGFVVKERLSDGTAIMVRPDDPTLPEGPSETDQASDQAATEAEATTDQAPTPTENESISDQVAEPEAQTTELQPVTPEQRSSELDTPVKSATSPPPSADHPRGTQSESTQKRHDADNQQRIASDRPGSKSAATESSNERNQAAYAETLKAIADLGGIRGQLISMVYQNNVTLAEAADGLGIDLSQAQALYADGIAEVKGIVGEEALDQLNLDEPQLTSTMNAVMNAERRLVGKEEILRGARVAHQETFDSADAEMTSAGLNADNENNAAKKIIDDLLDEGKPIKSVGPIQEAILLIEKVRVQNMRGDAAKRANDGLVTQQERDQAQEDWVKLEAYSDRIDRATRASGEAWGRMGAFRQQALRKDLTLATHTERARAFKGAALSPDEARAVEENFEQQRDLNENLEDAQKDAVRENRAKAVETRIGEVQEMAKNADRDANEQTESGEFTPGVLALAALISKRMERAAQSAIERLREEGIVRADPEKLNIRLVPKVIAASALKDLAIVAANWVNVGIKTAVQVSAAFANQLGIDVQHHIDAIIKKRDQIINKNVADSTPTRKKRKDTKRQLTKETAQENIDATTAIATELAAQGHGLKDMRGLIDSLVFNIVWMGNTDRDSVVREVMTVLNPAFDGKLTVAQVEDAISRYGDFRPLDKDPTKTEIRRIKGELQKIGQLRDLKAGEPRKKTGPERRKQEAQERELTRQVNELEKQLQKEGKLPPTDPEKHLRSAAQAEESRYRNEIADIENALATGQRITRNRAKFISTEEAKRLRKKLELLRKEYAEAFPPTPRTQEQIIAQVISSLDKRIDRLQQDIREGRYLPEAKAKSITSTEIEAKREQIAALNAEKATMRSLDSAFQEQKKQERLLKAIDKAMARLQGDIPQGTVEATVDTQEVAAMRLQLEQLRKDIHNSPEEFNRRSDDLMNRLRQKEAELTGRIAEGDTAPRPRSRAEARRDVQQMRDRVAALNKQIREIELERTKGTKSVREENNLRNRLAKQLERILQDGERRAKKHRVDSKEVAELRGEIAKAREEIAQRPANVARLIEERTDRIKAAIRDLQRRIEEGDTSPRRETKKPDLTPEQEKLSQQYQDLVRQMQKLRMEDHQYRLNLKIGAMRRQLAEFQRRIAESDFSERKLEPIRLDADGRRINAELVEAKREYARMLFEFRRANKGKIAKTLDAVGLTLDAIRSVMTSLDVSATFRQGGKFSFAHPVKSAEILMKSIRAFSPGKKGEQAEIELWQEIQASPQYTAAVEAKLALVDPLETDPARMEDAFRQARVNRIPGVAASSRVYMTQLNLMRMDLFERLVASVGKNGEGMTKEKAEAAARFVNLSTGRAAFRSDNAWARAMQGAMPALARVFFSPNLLLANAQWMVTLGMNLALAPGRQFQKDQSMRALQNAILAEQVRALMGMTTVMAALANSGGDVEWDPTSSDFMKVKFGNTRIDIWGGMQQVFVFAARLGLKRKKQITGDTRDFSDSKQTSRGANQIVMDFARTKFAPHISLGVNAYMGRNIIGENTDPREVEGLKNLGMSMAPMILGDLMDNASEGEAHLAPLWFVMNALGFGTQSFDATKERDERSTDD